MTNKLKFTLAGFLILVGCSAVVGVKEHTKKPKSKIQRTGTWSGGSGGGGIAGPGSSTDSAVALWNGTGGATLKDGPAYTSANTASAIAARDSNGDLSLRKVTTTGTTSVPGIVCQDVNTKPCLSSLATDTRGYYFLADGTTQIQQGTASKVLMNNTNVDIVGGFRIYDRGSLIANPVAGLRTTLTTTYTACASTNSADTDCHSTTLHGGGTTATGSGWSGYAFGTIATSASVDKRIIVLFGSDTLLDTGSMAITTAASWRLDWTCFRDGAATGKCNTNFVTSDATIFLKNSTVSITPTWANDQTFKYTLKQTTANNDMIITGSRIFWDPNN